MPERAPDGSTSASLRVCCFEALTTGPTAPDPGITPFGHTAAHSDAHVTAQQSMSSCWSGVCDAPDIGQLAEGEAKAGPEATARDSARNSRVTRRRIRRP